jgi:hypothetical protein
MTAYRSPLSREAQLLALSTQTAPQDAALSRLLDSNLNWRKVVHLAHQEGATATLWHCLLRTGTDRVPHDVATQWKKLAMVSEFQMQHLERLLHESLDVLAGEGIEAMLLKGSALGYTHYSSFTDRPMGDLDLLVRHERAREAWSLLQAKGWTWPSERWPAALYTAHQHLPPLVSSRGGGACLEIHTELLPRSHPFQWPIADVWLRAQRLHVRGRPILVPDSLEQLLHVCVHFAWSHEMKWGGWRTLRDIATLTARGDVTWPRFVLLAQNSRTATCCYWTLRLARTYAGAAVPDDVLRALRPPRPEFLLRRLEHHYVLQLFAVGTRCPPETLSKTLWEVGIAPRWSHHGSARPWQGSERWTSPARPPLRRTAWPRRFLSRAGRAAVGLGYLGRLTASRFPHLA